MLRSSFPNAFVKKISHSTRPPRTDPQVCFAAYRCCFELLLLFVDRAGRHRLSFRDQSVHGARGGDVHRNQRGASCHRELCLLIVRVLQFDGQRYGTSRAAVQKALTSGKIPLFERTPFVFVCVLLIVCASCSGHQRSAAGAQPRARSELRFRLHQTAQRRRAQGQAGKTVSFDVLFFVLLLIVR